MLDAAYEAEADKVVIQPYAMLRQGNVENSIDRFVPVFQHDSHAHAWWAIYRLSSSFEC